MSNKKLFGFLSLFAWVIVVSVVVFNNSFQFISALENNNNLILSFTFIVITFTIYGFKNKKKLKII